MMNNVIVVGRLVKNIELKEKENGGKYCDFTLAVTRSYKNCEGCYDTDFIDFKAFHNNAEQVAEWCFKGDLIGVRGRIETELIENEIGEKKKITFIVADKISFLSSNMNKKEVE